MVFHETILMKYHALFFSKIRKNEAKFVVCCSCDWRYKEQQALKKLSCVRINGSVSTRYILMQE